MFDFVLNIPALICFIIGLAFLIAEMFTPGIGLSGAAGAIFLIVAVAIQANSIEQGLLLLIIVFVIIAIFAIIFFRSASKGRIEKSPIVLKDQITDHGHDFSYLIGQTGIVLTDLRPAGSAKIGDKKYDVVARSAFISAGEQIKVTEVDGMRIVVERIDF